MHSICIMQTVSEPRTFYLAFMETWYASPDVFRFTFYWTLIFYVPIFLVCGSYAFFNYAIPPSLRKSTSTRQDRESHHLVNIASQPRVSARFVDHPIKTPKTNERRSRVAFALIVLLTFLILSVIGAVIASAILGYIMAGVYKAANFNMSTYVLSIV